MVTVVQEEVRSASRIMFAIIPGLVLSVEGVRRAINEAFVHPNLFQKEVTATFCGSRCMC